MSQNNLTHSDIAHLEHLSALRIDDDHRDSFVKKFETVVSFLSRLQHVDCDDHAPTTYISLSPQQLSSDHLDHELFEQNIKHVVVDHGIDVVSAIAE